MHVRCEGRIRSRLDHESGTVQSDRQPIEAAFLSELTHTAVAAQLDQPLGTIKTRIRSGLGKLRRALNVGVEEP